MDSSQRQKPQRAPGDKATVDRLFLLDLSDNRVVSLVASKRGGTTTSVQCDQGHIPWLNSPPSFTVSH